MPERLRSLARRHGRRLWRYSLGSVVAVVASQATFFVLYAVGSGARTASIVGFLAGVLPNYHLSRRWAWERTGRSRLVREILPYAAVVGVSLIAATAGTELLEGWIRRLGLSHRVNVVLVTAAFALVNGGLFVAKYVVYDRWLFGRRTPNRSRHQVPTRTRA